MAFRVVGIAMVTTIRAMSKDIPMVTMVSIDELRGMLDNPDLTLIDVRYDKDCDLGGPRRTFSSHLTSRN